MQQAQGMFEHVNQDRAGGVLGGFVLTVQRDLGRFDVPIAVFAPDKLVEFVCKTKYITVSLSCQG